MSWSATYAIGREKVREYAYAVGESEPLYLDVEAARAAGYADVVAPPMFAAVYCGPAIGPVCAFELCSAEISSPVRRGWSSKTCARMQGMLCVSSSNLLASYSSPC